MSLGRPTLRAVYGRVFGVAVAGVHGHLINVEAHVGRGLPALTLSGLPGAGVQDARERVRPAVESSGLQWPLRRVVVNLSPARVRKDGPGFDLPIALGVLAASGQVPGRLLSRYAFAGELTLKGELVATAGILAVAIAAAQGGLDGVVVPEANLAEAELVEGLRVVAVPSLAAVVGFLRGEWVPQPSPARPTRSSDRGSSVDFSEVRGQGVARRALEIAAAGGHNALLIGPPGAGKTMLARRLPSILPTMTRQEALEVTRLHSVAGILAGGGLVDSRPFRAPHHTISPAGLLGGGSGFLRPGEASCCASQLRTGASSWPELLAPSSSRQGLAWSPRRTRARAGSTAIPAGTADAFPTGSMPIASAYRVRCWTAWTSSFRSRA